MEYIYDLNKKTSEIPRNPTSSKWSENFWSCLQVIRQVLNNKQKFDIVFLGFIALAHLQVLCPLPKERSPLWYLFVYIYLCINIYIYIYILYTVQPVLSDHPRGFYGQYSAFEVRNILNDMAVLFNAL